MGIVHPNENEFEQLLQDNSAVLVDFWAPWCGPCRMVGPIIEKLAAKYDGRAVVAKVDIDEQSALAERYKILSIPTVIVFKDGAPVKQEVGAHSQDVYEKMIESVL